ncbi:MAG: bacteriohemerythrin [Clostridia bacterium]|jgi:hemerythrin|nr:bacteriohemerythrin [Clostridia bacterium]
MSIKWDDQYLTGIEKIDEQHKRLFEIAGSLYDLLRNDVYIDKYDRIMIVLDELKEYTDFHFKTEENFMKETGYKKYLSHKARHDDFIAKVNGLDLNEIDENQEDYLAEILDFVCMWIRNHILSEDKQYIQR